jgi:DNA-binding PadR family transcriptional regulator
MTLGKTSYVILGMLKLGKRTGYEIKSLVDVSTRFFWAASYGQIYPELARLEQAGLVRGKLDRESGRGRKAYELTPAGEEALHEWLVSNDELHVELRHEGFLKLFFADALSDAERAELARRLRTRHEAIAEQLRGIRPGAGEQGEEGKRMPLLVLEWGIAYEEFMSDWCERLERELAAVEERS